MTISTGKTILTMSMSRRGARIAAGVCALGLALVLGGCNNSLKDENAALTQENAQLREKTASFESQQAAMQAQIAQMQQQQAPATTGSPGFERDTGSSRGTSTRDRGERVIDVIAGDLLFLPGQASVRAESRKELDKVARDIQSKHAGRTIRVKGYTDTDPIMKVAKKYPTNEALSLARAESVASYLISKGVSRSTIETVGMGSANPKKTKKESRRVEIVVVE